MCSSGPSRPRPLARLATASRDWGASESGVCWQRIRMKLCMQAVSEEYRRHLTQNCEYAGIPRARSRNWGMPANMQVLLKKSPQSMISASKGCKYAAISGPLPDFTMQACTFAAMPRLLYSTSLMEMGQLPIRYCIHLRSPAEMRSTAKTSIR